MRLNGGGNSTATLGYEAQLWQMAYALRGSILGSPPTRKVRPIVRIRTSTAPSLFSGCRQLVFAQNGGRIAVPEVSRPCYPQMGEVEIACGSHESIANPGQADGRTH
jgi:hypothetical protein